MKIKKVCNATNEYKIVHNCNNNKNKQKKLLPSPTLPRLLNLPRAVGQSLTLSDFHSVVVSGPWDVVYFQSESLKLSERFDQQLSIKNIARIANAVQCHSEMSCTKGWIQIFNCQNCNQCLKCHKSLVLSKLSKLSKFS